MKEYRVNEPESHRDTFKEFLEKATKMPVEGIIVLGGGVKKIITGQGKAEIIQGRDIYDGLVGSSKEGEDLQDFFVRLSSTSYSEPADRARKIHYAGKAKDIASAQIAKDLAVMQPNKDFAIVVNSIAPYNKSTKSDAEISKDALVALGVKNEVILQSRSFDTFTELLEILRMATEKGWRHIVITTQKTQQLRVRAMLHTLMNLQEPQQLKMAEEMMAYNANRFSRQNFPDRLEDARHFNDTFGYLKENRPTVEVSVVTAEDVLKHRRPGKGDKPGLYGKLLDELSKLPTYRQRLIQDADDFRRWESGSYTQAGARHVEAWKKGELP